MPERKAPNGDNPFQFTLTPASHTVVFTRSGYQPFEKRLDLEPGVTFVLRPVWKTDDR